MCYDIRYEKKKSINCYAETQVIRNEIKQSTNRARRK